MSSSASRKSRGLRWLRLGRPQSGSASRPSAVGGAPASPVPRPDPLQTPVRLLVGPANFAGQGNLWARAAERQFTNVGAHSFAFIKGKLDYPSDYGVPGSVYRRSRRWQLEQERLVPQLYTHVLIEAARPIFGGLRGHDASYEIPYLLEHGVRVALAAHGSDVRIPSQHAEKEPWSPFPTLEEETVDLLERNARRNVELMNSYPGLVVVSTPDLLDYVPKAVWCPVVVESDRWASEVPVLRRKVPVVAHAPSKSYMKGSSLIDPVLSRLAARGLIQYRRVKNVDPARMPEVYRDADIVADQFLIGSYGVAACEAMAAGRVVIGHVTDQVRARVRDQTGWELPIIEATPDNLEQVILDILDRREEVAAIASQGPGYVQAVHDGHRSAAALGPFLNNEIDVDPDWAPSWVRPKVVMMAGNDIIPDARVLKYAQSVARFGFDVTAIGIPGKQLRGNREVGPVHVMCPPIAPRAMVTGWRRRLSQLKPWISDQAEYSRALGRWQYDSRELRADRGRDERDRERFGRPRNLTLGERVGRAVRWRMLKLRRSVLEARALPMQWQSGSDSDTDLGFGRARDRLLRFYRYTPAGRWRRVLPEVIDQELTLGPLLDRLQPELIHVHDVFMLGIGARAVHRAALEGRDIKLIYDAHEYIPGVPVVAARRVAALADLEREFIHDADRVITVSEPLARLLQRDHGLARRPDVVLNAPVEPPADAEIEGLRDRLELSDGVPLLVYVGGVNRARGVATAVDALVAMPDVHLAIVARPNPVTAELQRRADALGVADRFHVTPFVEPELVPLYVASATIGISPLLHAPNHDIAITNKFCEYIAAGLPIITSDTPAQADLVRELNLGGVFRAGDVDDFVRVTNQVLADTEHISRRIQDDAELRHRFSWAAQAEVIRSVYHEVLGYLPEQAWKDDATILHHLILDPPEG